MSRRLFRIFLSAFLVVCVCAFFIARSVDPSSPSHAAEAHTTTRSVTSGRIAQSSTAALAYWTPVRMLAAHPADELLAHAVFTKKVQASTGPSGMGAPVLPKTPKYATKVPHSSYSTFPYSTVGKVFFTDPSTGLNYVCSGAAVNSTNLSVVDTAGHCVVGGGSGGDWYTNWVFCPQYYAGSTPYGCWAARQLWSYTDWVNLGSLEDDFGDAVVSANSYGNLVTVVGGTGWAYGQSTTQKYTSLGYPQAAPFNGKYMYKCGATKTAIVSSYDDGTVLAISCNMTGGSSGGPWLISISGTFGYVNGHNDFKYNNDPAHMYSPYYDSDWYAVFNSAQNS